MVFIQILLLVLLFLVGFLSLSYYFRDHQHYSTTRRKLFTWIKFSSPRSSDKILNPPADKDSINSRSAATAAYTGSCRGDNGENGKRVEGGGDNQAKKEEGHGKTILQRRITQASSAGDLRNAFDVFDGDGDGSISVEELGLVLTSRWMTQGSRVEICKQIINKVDLDGDGMVNFEEIKRMMMTISVGLFSIL